MLTTESQAGREAEAGGLAESQTFLGKNKGTFQHTERHLGARPDVLTPRSRLCRERVLFSCPAPKLEGGSGLGPVAWRAHSVSTALLNVTPAAHSKSPYALYKLLTLLKCPNAFLSLPTKPPGVPTPDQEAEEPFQPWTKPATCRESCPRA